jgi:hypothetical protein
VLGSTCTETLTGATGFHHRDLLKNSSVKGGISEVSISCSVRESTFSQFVLEELFISLVIYEINYSHLIAFPNSLRTLELSRLLGKVVEQFAVNEAIATADALEQATLNAVVEETGVVPRNFAVLSKDDTKAEV